MTDPRHWQTLWFKLSMPFAYKPQRFEALFGKGKLLIYNLEILRRSIALFGWSFTQQRCERANLSLNNLYIGGNSFSKMVARYRRWSTLIVFDWTMNELRAVRNGQKHNQLQEHSTSPRSIAWLALFACSLHLISFPFYARKMYPVLANDRKRSSRRGLNSVFMQSVCVVLRF